MQEKDAVTNEYFRDTARIADLINVFVFKGQQVLEAKDVQELGEVVSRIDSADGKTDAKTFILDVVKKVCKGVLVTIIHLENQSDIHYAMPIRVMNGEAAYYHREWMRAAGRHKKAKDLEGAEYMSGFAKGEKIVSAITIVVYWGQKAWDGPKRLKEMLNVEDYPLEMQQMIVDYPIHLLEIRKFKQLELFQSDIQYVFGFLQRDRDKKKLAEYVETNREIFSELPESTYNVISKMSRCAELKKVKNKAKKEKERYDMCQAITEMIEEGKREGKRDGILAGRCQERKKTILFILGRQGSVPEELEKKIKKEKDLNVLGEWFQLALDSDSIETFERAMQ